jgi:hypothetical protein
MRLQDIGQLSEALTPVQPLAIALPFIAVMLVRNDSRLTLAIAYLHHKTDVRFGALEEVFMSYRPHGAWRTMEVLEELA